MERDVMWSSWGEPGLEHLRLVQDDEKVSADGIILGVQDGNPFRVHYKICCDSAWRVREVDINLLDSDSKNITLCADGKGYWTDGSGNPIPALNDVLKWIFRQRRSRTL